MNSGEKKKRREREEQRHCNFKLLKRSPRKRAVVSQNNSRLSIPASQSQQSPPMRSRVLQILHNLLDAWPSPPHFAFLSQGSETLLRPLDPPPPLFRSLPPAEAVTGRATLDGNTPDQREPATNVNVSG